MYGWNTQLRCGCELRGQRSFPSWTPFVFLPLTNIFKVSVNTNANVRLVSKEPERNAVHARTSTNAKRIQESAVKIQSAPTQSEVTLVFATRATNPVEKYRASIKTVSMWMSVKNRPRPNANRTRSVRTQSEVTTVLANQDLSEKARFSDAKVVLLIKKILG